MDNDISDLILKAVPAYKIRERARKNGMITLLEDGITKIKRGDTSTSATSISTTTTTSSTTTTTSSGSSSSGGGY